MNYWLFKTEPGCFSFDDLKKRPDMTEPWDGVRNFQARNFLRDMIMPLVKRSRLSIQPITADEWWIILIMAGMVEGVKGQ